jgi:hypothetical protein
VIWILVLTLIITDGKGTALSSSGAALPFSSETSCQAAAKRMKAEANADPRPNVLMVIGCSAVTLPGVV